MLQKETGTMEAKLSYFNRSEHIGLTVVSGYLAHVQSSRSASTPPITGPYIVFKAHTTLRIATLFPRILRGIVRKAHMDRACHSIYKLSYEQDTIKNTTHTDSMRLLTSTIFVTTILVTAAIAPPPRPCTYRIANRI